MVPEVKMNRDVDRNNDRAIIALFFTTSSNRTPIGEIEKGFLSRILDKKTILLLVLVKKN